MTNVLIIEDQRMMRETMETYIKQTEGYQSANWILLDYGDIIVHVFDTENRLFYDLERIWRDGKEIQVEEL